MTKEGAVERAGPGADDPAGRLGLAAAALGASTVFMAWWLHWFDLVDLEVYRAGALALLHGRDIYRARPPGSGLPFTYPPFAALAFVPFGGLPDLAARVAMSLASGAALLVTATIALRLAAPGWPTRARWTVAMAIAAATPFFEPLRDTFRLGQINLILMALVVADLAPGKRAASKRAAGNQRWRGVLLGLATATKLTPAIFVVYLLATRRYRHAATAAATAALATGLAFVLMPAASVDYWSRLVFDDKRIGIPGNVWNQSVRGVVARLTGSPDRGHLLWLIAAAALLATGMVLATRCHNSGDELLGLGLAALTGLLISPISWNHHWVWALPAAIGLWHRATESRRPGPVAVAVVWTAVFALASMSWWTFDGQDNYHLGAGHNVEAACYVVATLALFARLARSGSEPATSVGAEGLEPTTTAL